MKKFSEDNLRAMQFESLRLDQDHKGDSSMLSLYAIEGQPGVYRRVPLTTGDLLPGHVRAFLGKTKVELVRCDSVEEELREAGFVRPNDRVDTMPPAQRQGVLDRMFAKDEVRHTE